MAQSRQQERYPARASAHDVDEDNPVEQDSTFLKGLKIEGRVLGRVLQVYTIKPDSAGPFKTTRCPVEWVAAKGCPLNLFNSAIVVLKGPDGRIYT